MREKTIVDLTRMDRHISYVSYCRNRSANQSLQKKKEKAARGDINSNGRTKSGSVISDERMPTFVCPPPDLTSSAAEAVMRRATAKQQERERRQHAMLESAVSAAAKDTKEDDAHNYQNVVVGETTITADDQLIRPPPRTTSSTLELKSTEGEDAVYANTQTTTTTDSGNCPDYQNAIIPIKPAKVSLKIQQLLHSLQSLILSNLLTFWRSFDTMTKVIANPGNDDGDVIYELPKANRQKTVVSLQNISACAPDFLIRLHGRKPSLGGASEKL
uniref:Uncharacterized protein n=1 Tax=Steinernema glaseri TaxID=37863 RepID=A0A1I8A339_9BILA